MADTEQVDLKEARAAQAAATRASKGVEVPTPAEGPKTLEEVAALVGMTVAQFTEQFGAIPSPAVVAATPPRVPIPTTARKPGDTRQVDISRRKELMETYKNENKVQINISPMYAPWVGKRMPMCINGIFIYIDSDGMNYEVPESFADVWFERKMYIDKMFRRLLGMSNISGNLEATPGELHI